MNNKGNIKKNNKKLIYDIVSKIFLGIFMGISDGIPGYSGGTTLSLFNFYDVLMNKIKLLFKKNKSSIWFSNLFSLLPFFIAWIIFLVLFSLFSSFISKQGTNYQIVLFILFFSFSFFCIPIFILKNIYFDWNKIKNSNIKKKLYLTVTTIVFFLIIVSIGIYLYFNGGISLEKKHIGNKIQFNPYVLFILFTCFLSGFCMLIPGISGSLILFLAQTYDDVYWIALQNPLENIGLLLLIVLFIILGIVTSIFTINLLIKKYYYFFKCISLGLVCGSPIAMILSFLGNNSYLISLQSIFMQWNNSIIFFILAISLSIIINAFLLFAFIFKNKRIKLKFMNLEYLKNSALIVVDLQNDFYINGSLEIKNSDEIVDYISDVIYFFKIKNLKIIFSQDYHPSNHCSFSLWPKHCVKGEYGSEFVEIISKQDADIIIKKGTSIDVDNYSAFYDGNDESKLNNFLKENNIVNLYILGLAGDYCVKQTALDALKFGYNVVLLSNGIRCVNKDFKLSSISDKIRIV